MWKILKYSPYSGDVSSNPQHVVFIPIVTHNVKVVDKRRIQIRKSPAQGQAFSSVKFRAGNPKRDSYRICLTDSELRISLPGRFFKNLCAYGYGFCSK